MTATTSCLSDFACPERLPLVLSATTSDPRAKKAHCVPCRVSTESHRRQHERAANLHRTGDSAGTWILVAGRKYNQITGSRLVALIEARKYADHSYFPEPLPFLLTCEARLACHHDTISTREEASFCSRRNRLTTARQAY